MDQVALRMEDHGIDAWFDLDAAELLGEDAENYEKVTDTLDVWFDSVSPMSVLRQRSGSTGPLTCIWRAPISIAVGSSPRS